MARKRILVSRLISRSTSPTCTDTAAADDGGERWKVREMEGKRERETEEDERERERRRVRERDGG